ncbi:hypothetical protein KC678_04620 [Candidatus Dojkabacteria bacterium]|uniref:Uncharacterized protein n=1 Tax=Candidatus Dojkabacteria bacterium TaxID=2099670 RepID=A0A955RH65_9BACT|nr:hypothetical protein [Candidatus Dojkabacteria bacterium]
MGVPYETKLQYPNIDQESIQDLPRRERDKALRYLKTLVQLGKPQIIYSIPAEHVEQIIEIRSELDMGRFIQLHNNKSMEAELPTITMRYLYTAFDGDIAEMSQLISNETYREALLDYYNKTSPRQENKRVENAIQMFVININQIRQEKEKFDLEQAEQIEHEKPMELDDFL